MVSYVTLSDFGNANGRLPVEAGPLNSTVRALKSATAREKGLDRKGFCIGLDWRNDPEMSASSHL